jgi:acyl-CoA thioesterase
MKSPVEIIKLMMQNDAFSKWMGIHVESISVGSCILRMTVTPEMLNGFGILHGGVSFSLSDTALAFASNSYGLKSVSIETSISHLKSVHLGDILTATAVEVHRGQSIGFYDVTVKNQHLQKIASFKGTVSISKEIW